MTLSGLMSRCAIPASCAAASAPRALMSLSRLWQGQGKQGEPHSMLAQCYDGFTEGFETTDLRQAETLLRALS